MSTDSSDFEWTYTGSSESITPAAIREVSSSDSSKDEGKYIVLFVACFFAVFVTGFAVGWCAKGSDVGETSALPVKEPNEAATEMTRSETA